MNKVKIGFLTLDNPQDKKAWSGLMFQFFRALSQNNDIVWIPVKHSFIGKRYMKYIKIRSKISGNKFTRHFSLPAKRGAKKINKKLLDSVDIIFAPAASTSIAYLKTDKPIIYLTDTAFSLMVDYYYFNLSDFNIREGNRIEQLAATKSSHIIVSSEWAQKAYIEYYSIPKEKVSVIEFGANIDGIELVENINNKINNPLNILFLGVEWERKRGAIAVESVKILNQLGIEAVLYVVGTDTPLEYLEYDFIKSAGFLNKNKEEEYQRLREIISKSDILLLPTKAECAGVAFSEASAYRLPIFTYDTGGIANYVINGQNGYRLPLSATGSDFTQKIKECIEEGELPKLKNGCERLYMEKLNWNVWNKKTQAIIDKCMEAKIQSKGLIRFPIDLN